MKENVHNVKLSLNKVVFVDIHLEKFNAIKQSYQHKNLSVKKYVKKRKVVENINAMLYVANLEHLYIFRITNAKKLAKNH